MIETVILTGVLGRSGRLPAECELAGEQSALSTTKADDLLGLGWSLEHS